MMIDVTRARRETPGCDEVLHFDNAGASLMPAPVVETLRAHLELETRVGGYRAAALREDEIEAVYASVAALIGCDPEEVAVVDNATRAWDMAFYSMDLRPGDRVLTSASEYVSNFLALLQVTARTGAGVEVVPADGDGVVSIPALESMLDDRVRLVALTHVPTNGGPVEPAAEVGALVRETGAVYLLDACQSVGQMPIAVDDLGCDVLSATGRKFLRGPRGVGFLYVRRPLLERLEPPFLDVRGAEWVGEREYRLRPDARRFETWERNIGAVLGLGAAVDYALGWGLEEIRHWSWTLAGLLRVRLAAIPGVVVRDLGRERCAIVTFTAEEADPAEVAETLVERGMNVTVSTRSSTRLDMDRRDLDAVVRASVHYYNTEDEVSRFCAAVAEIAG